MKLPYPRGGRCGRGRENKQNLFHNERIIPKPNRKVNTGVSGQRATPPLWRGPITYPKISPYRTAKKKQTLPPITNKCQIACENFNLRQR